MVSTGMGLMLLSEHHNITSIRTGNSINLEVVVRGGVTLPLETRIERGFLKGDFGSTRSRSRDSDGLCGQLKVILMLIEDATETESSVETGEAFQIFP